MFNLKYENELPGVVASELRQLVNGIRRYLLTSLDEDGNILTTTATGSALVPVGGIIPFGGTTAPAGWLICDGMAVSRADFAALFLVIGTTYGAGNGSTTFNPPDLRQRFPMGKAVSGTGAVLGVTGGTIDHVHSGPSHRHAVSITTGTPSATTNVGLGAADTAVASATHTHLTSGDTELAGTGNTGTANPPFQTVNYIIKI